MSFEFDPNRDIKDYITTIDLFKNMKLFDSTVELIGIIQSCLNPKLVCGGTKRVMTIVLTNSDTPEWHAQLSFFDEDIEKWESILKPSKVIHVEWALAVELCNKYSLGKNVKYDLRSRSNTKITELGVYNVEEEENEMDAVEIEMEDCCNHDNVYVSLKGYIKSEFRLEHIKGTILNVASLAKDNLKIEIRCYQNANTGDVKRGDPVKVSGIMHSSDFPCFIFVSNCKKIEKLQSRCYTNEELFNAVDTPSKKADPFEEMDYSSEDLGSLI